MKKQPKSFFLFLYTFFLLLSYEYLHPAAAGSAAAPSLEATASGGSDYSEALPLSDIDLEKFSTACARKFKVPQFSSRFEYLISIRGERSICESCRYPKSSHEEHPRLFCKMLSKTEEEVASIIEEKKVDPLALDFSGNTLLEILIYSHVTDEIIIVLLNKLITKRPDFFRRDPKNEKLAIHLMLASMVTYRSKVFMYLCATIKDSFYSQESPAWPFLARNYAYAKRQVLSMHKDSLLHDIFYDGLQEIKCFFKGCMRAHFKDKKTLFFGSNKDAFLRLPFLEQIRQLSKFLEESIRDFQTNNQDELSSKQKKRLEEVAAWDAAASTTTAEPINKDKPMAAAATTVYKPEVEEIDFLKQTGVRLPSSQPAPQPGEQKVAASGAGEDSESKEDLDSTKATHALCDHDDTRHPEDLTASLLKTGEKTLNQEISDTTDLDRPKRKRRAALVAAREVSADQSSNNNLHRQAEAIPGHDPDLMRPRRSRSNAAVSGNTRLNAVPEDTVLPTTRDELRHSRPSTESVHRDVVIKENKCCIVM